jgi:HK97 gp10 family phage protein
MASRVEVKGLKELGQKLQQLATKDALKICKSATGGAAQVIKKKAKAKAVIAEKAYIVRRNKNDSGILVQPGNVPKNIIIKQIGSRLTSEHIVAVRAKRKDGYAQRIGILLEFGTVKQPPRPFMRPALSDGKNEAITVMKKRIVDGLNKVTK